MVMAVPGTWRRVSVSILLRAQRTRAVSPAGRVPGTSVDVGAPGVQR